MNAKRLSRWIRFLTTAEIFYFCFIKKKPKESQLIPFKRVDLHFVIEHHMLLKYVTIFMFTAVGQQTNSMHVQDSFTLHSASNLDDFRRNQD